jgi:hypothetical protein
VKQALPARGTTTAGPSRRGLLLIVAVVVLLAVALRGCFFHENAYERIARDVTVAIQRNDYNAVLGYNSAETASRITRAQIGRAADALTPLGEIKSVKEVAVDTDRRRHEFDLTFAHGKVHETIGFDPQNKIVVFHYDPPVKT